MAEGLGRLRMIVALSNSPKRRSLWRKPARFMKRTPARIRKVAMRLGVSFKATTKKKRIQKIGRVQARYRRRLLLIQKPAFCGGRRPKRPPSSNFASSDAPALFSACLATCQWGLF